MHILLRPWLRFYDFKGRSSRTELAWFLLTAFLLAGAITTTATALTGVDFNQRNPQIPLAVGIPVVALLVAIAVPFFAVMVRRMHDQNKSGWFTLLIGTGIGALFLLIILVYPGTDNWNAYGADPRYFPDDGEPETHAAGQI